MAKKYNFTLEEVSDAIEVSRSIKEFLIALGMKVNNGNYRRAAQICSDFGLEVPKHDYSTNGNTLREVNRFTDKEFFCVGKLRGGTSLKKRLIKDHGYLDICSECGQEPIWNGKPLTLQVDHIDGDRFNNLIENLRIMCGHCHSQTETYGNKSAKSEIYNYCSCGIRIWKLSKACRSCSPKDVSTGLYKYDYPPVEEVVSKIQELGGWSAASRFFGIGDNTLRKHLRRNGVDPTKIRYRRTPNGDSI